MPNFACYRILLAGFCLIVCSSLVKAGDIVSVNDYGSGFIVTYEYQIQPEDAPDGSVNAWRISAGYTGSAQLSGAWMTGFNGSVNIDTSGNSLQISNEDVGHKPEISVGSSLTFNIQGQGGGFNAEDFNIAFANLDPVGNGTTSSGFVSVNDWYNPNSGGGFNATFECLVTSDVPFDEFIAEFNYTGSGTPASAWTNSYNGSVETGFIGRDGGYAVTSAASGFRPELNNGDRFLVVIQVQGAGFSEADFDFTCVDASNNPPVANAGQNVTASAGSNIGLNGGLSSDEDGDALSYQWEIISQPDDSVATLSNADTGTPTLNLDLEGEYVVELVVNDGITDSDPVQVTITATAMPLCSLRFPPMRLPTLPLNSMNGILMVTVPLTHVIPSVEISLLLFRAVSTRLH